jgi:hypothetical protein
LSRANRPFQHLAPPSGATPGEEAEGRLENDDWDEERILAKYKRLFTFYKKAMGDVLGEEVLARMAMERA